MQEKSAMDSKAVKETAPVSAASVAAAPVQEKRKPGRPAGSKNGTSTKAKAAKTTKKAADKKEMETKIVLQFKGRDAECGAVIDRIKEKIVAEGHRAGAIKKLEVYIKPEESKAYYVINDGKFTGDVALF